MTRPSVWEDPVVQEEAAAIFRRALARLEAAEAKAERKDQERAS